MTWLPDELERMTAPDELEIAVRRADGTLRHGVPVWVVRLDDQAYVRTWYRRDGGWFGRVLRTGRARIRVPGTERDVLVDDVGEGTPGLRAGVDQAYRDKYGRYGDATLEAMVNDGAAATTLRLRPEPDTSPGGH